MAKPKATEQGSKDEAETPLVEEYSLRKKHGNPDRIRELTQHTCAYSLPIWCFIVSYLIVFVALPIVLANVLNERLILVSIGVVPFLTLVWSCITHRQMYIPNKYPGNSAFVLDTDTPGPVAVKIKHAVVIVNPNSGGRRGERMANEVVAHFKDIKWTVWRTQYAGHAYAMCAGQKDWTDIDVVFSAGGDGTFHEVSNGLLTNRAFKSLKANAPCVGVIPVGTGNSFSRDLGFLDSNNMIETVGSLLSGHYRHLDVNLVRDEQGMHIYSINEVSIGLIGEVGSISEFVRWLGPIRYDLCGLWFLIKKVFAKQSIQIFGTEGITARKNKQEMVVIDGAEVLACCVNLTKTLGKNLRTTPRAVLNDGLLDILVINRGSRFDYLQIFTQLKTGAQVAEHEDLCKSGKDDNADAIENVCAVYYQSKHVRLSNGTLAKPVKPSGGSLANIDGEMYIFHGYLDIEVEPQALKMLIGTENASDSKSGQSRKKGKNV